jgi:hypothetical protein
MKKLGFLTLLITAMLLLTLALPTGSGSKTAGVIPVAAAAPALVAPVLVTPAMPPHPHIHEGLEAMRAAKHHLESAEGDFHGHRHKAIEHLDQAIHEAEECEREP